MHEYQWTSILAYADYMNVTSMCLDHKGVVQDPLGPSCTYLNNTVPLPR